MYIYIQTGTCSQSLILHDYFYNTSPPAEPGVDRQSATEAFDILHQDSGDLTLLS